MSGSWRALGGLLAGVGGAALIAALVLGRGGQPEVMTWGTLETEGGVLWMRVESYERPAIGGDSDARLELEIQETWTRVQERTAPETIFAVHSPVGVMLLRSRIVGGHASPEGVTETVPRIWPRPRGNSVGQGDRSCDGYIEGMALVKRGGSMMCVRQLEPPTQGLSTRTAGPDWPPDLEVVSMQEEVRFNAHGGLESVQFRALLKDGSRVVIASQRFHFTLLPLSEWKGIEELVFGE